MQTLDIYKYVVNKSSGTSKRFESLNYDFKL